MARTNVVRYTTNTVKAKPFTGTALNGAPLIVIVNPGVIISSAFLPFNPTVIEPAMDLVGSGIVVLINYGIVKGYGGGGGLNTLFPGGGGGAGDAVGVGGKPGASPTAWGDDGTSTLGGAGGQDVGVTGFPVEINPAYPGGHAIRLSNSIDLIIYNYGVIAGGGGGGAAAYASATDAGDGGDLGQPGAGTVPILAPAGAAGYAVIYKTPVVVPPTVDVIVAGSILGPVDY